MYYDIIIYIYICVCVCVCVCVFFFSNIMLLLFDNGYIDEHGIGHNLYIW